MLAKHKHPDPYILSWRPGGTQYHRNPPPVPEVGPSPHPPPAGRCALPLSRLSHTHEPLPVLRLQMCAQLPFSQ
jgi:hypothetical protein